MSGDVIGEENGAVKNVAKLLVRIVVLNEGVVVEEIVMKGHERIRIKCISKLHPSRQSEGSIYCAGTGGSEEELVVL